MKWRDWASSAEVSNVPSVRVALAPRIRQTDLVAGLPRAPRCLGSPLLGGQYQLSPHLIAQSQPGFYKDHCLAGVAAFLSFPARCLQLARAAHLPA
jgi:hypothetical protein